MSAQRPVTDDRTTTAIRFPTELHHQLRVAAAERGLSINWLVNRAIEEFLARLLPPAEIVLTRPRPVPTSDSSSPRSPASDPGRDSVVDYVLGHGDRLEQRP